MKVKYQDSDYIVGKVSEEFKTSIVEYARKIIQDGTLDEKVGNFLDAKFVDIDVERIEEDEFEDEDQDEDEKEGGGGRARNEIPDYIYAKYYIKEFDYTILFDLLKFLNNTELMNQLGVSKINWNYLDSLEDSETYVSLLFKATPDGYEVRIVPGLNIFIVLKKL